MDHGVTPGIFPHLVRSEAIILRSPMRNLTGRQFTKRTLQRSCKTTRAILRVTSTLIRRVASMHTQTYICPIAETLSCCHPGSPQSTRFPYAYAEEIECVQKNSSLHWVIFSNNEPRTLQQVGPLRLDVQQLELRYACIYKPKSQRVRCTEQLDGIWLASIRLCQSEASGQLQRQLSFRHRDCCHTRQP